MLLSSETRVGRLILCWAGGLLVAGGLFGHLDTQAQTRARFGAGLQAAGSTVTESVGPGLHLRASFPMNYELSFAVGGALTGFGLGGDRQAAYAMAPEASFVFTIPDPSSSSLYLLGGGGYHVPLKGGRRYDDVVAGPTFHVGAGKVWQLESTSLYLELAPTLFFRRERTDILAPLRGGIIF